MADEHEDREWTRPEYEEMAPRAIAARSFRAAIVAIPLGLVLLLVAPNFGYDLREAATLFGWVALIIGGVALLRGLWHKVA